MNFEDIFGSSAAVKFINVLSDDGDSAALPAQTLLALGDGQVSGVRSFRKHDLTTVVVKLPDAGRVSGERLRSGEILKGGCTVAKFISKNFDIKVKN